MLRIPVRPTLVLLAFFTFPTSAALAEVRQAATCNQPDVEAQVTAAADGETVTIPAGSCTWADGVPTGSP